MKRPATLRSVLGLVWDKAWPPLVAVGIFGYVILTGILIESW